MASQLEVPAPGEFIFSEAPGSYSRENVIVVAAAGVIPAGRLVGKITASGKYKNYDDVAADGTQTAAGILYAEVDASGASDVAGVIIVRDAEVALARVTAANPAHKAAGVTDLETIVTATNVGGIRFR